MSQSIWWRHLRFWLPALALVVVNIGVLTFYRMVYADEAQARGRLLARREAELAALTEKRQATEEIVTAAQRNRQRVRQFRGQRLGTERRRLTEVIAEVKELARRAGLEPSSIRYPAEPLTEYGLTSRSIVFSVDGDYAALRRFVNFLELSERFLTLEEVTLSGRQGSDDSLRISLQVSTLFLADSGDAEAGQS